jgi:uncharacterized Zn-finger protein
MEPENFTCTHEGCERTYTNSFNLKRHIESYHLGLKKFFCAICNKGLSSKQNMREHSFIHEGTKPYKCKFPRCPESFRQLSQLKMHQKFHKELAKLLESKSKQFQVNFSVFSESLSKFELGRSTGEEIEDYSILEELGSKILFEFEKGLEFW